MPNSPIFGDPQAPQPAPAAPVPPHIAARADAEAVESDPGTTPHNTAGAPHKRSAGSVEAPSTGEAAVASAAAKDPSKADTVADAILKMRGASPPASVSSHHILVIAVLGLLVFGYLSIDIITAGSGRYDESLRSAVMQAWIAIGLIIFGFYMGSSAGSTNKTASNQARGVE